MTDEYQADVEQIEQEDERKPIRLPAKGNDKLEEIVELANNDVELRTVWRMQNVTAVDRFGFPDHGQVHVQIVTNIALKIARLIFDDGVTPTLLEDFDRFSKDDAEVVIALAAMLHDAGMSIHRQDHEEFSLLVAKDIIDRFLDEIYDKESRIILRSEVLHAIISHRAGGNPLTLEAGIVRVADALDMEKGRSRIAFESGEVDIHSVSAAAVDEVELLEGEERPVYIQIHLNNSAGIFQVDELLKDKLQGSGLENHVAVEAVVEGTTEKQLVHHFKL